MRATSSRVDAWGDEKSARVSSARRIYTFARIAAADATGRHGVLAGPRAHLDAAVAWLKRAHDMGRRGVSYGYCLAGAWRPSYAETSGYISSTFFDLAEQRRDSDAGSRALEITRWLCEVQNDDGSIANPRYGDGGIVFDTGQVLEGFTRAYRETGDARFSDAAERAAAWLVRVADGEGRWTRNTFRGIPHVYNTRTAWPLLSWSEISPNPEYTRVARANLDWALDQQRPTGWFERCGFRLGEAPFTHTIAYAIEGLLQAGLMLDDARYTGAARRAAEAALRHVRADGFVPGRIDIEGNSAAEYSCLAGDTQLAAQWARLYEHGGDERFRSATALVLRYVMRSQDLDTDDPDVRGAIKGSQPLWGRYSPFGFPSWAAKFFIDAMLLAEGWC